MKRVERVLAPTDFSAAADRATRRAASIAATFGCALDLLHVLPSREMLEQIFSGSPASHAETFRVRADQALKERARRVAAQSAIAPACHLFDGSAHRAILDAVESLDAQLIVLGARGERDGVQPSETVGGTALKVAELSPVATVLVRREASARYDHVVACVKGVPADRGLIDWANSVSPADLIHVVSAYAVPFEERLIEWGASQSTLDAYATGARDARTRELGDLLKDIGLPAARARLHVERGDPLQVILRTAAQWQADLIITGRRARADALAGGPFGSVARQIAFRAPADVMIVPPPTSPRTPQPEQ